MKVLHILDHYLPLFSGYTFRSQYVMQNQKQVLGIDPVVVTSLKQGESSVPMDEIGGLKIYRTSGRQPAWARIPVLREYWQMKTLEKRILEVAAIEKPAVLHAHSPVLNAWPAIWASRRLGIPMVYEIRAFWEDAAVDHGTTTEGSLRYRATRAFETAACRRSDAVVTICEGLRKGLLERGLSKEKLFVLPNGVDTSKFPSPALDEALQARLGLKGMQVAGFIGTPYRYEGLSFLLKAVAALAPSMPQLRALIVGGGYDGEEDELKALAQKLGIGDRVIVQGKVPHEQVGSFYSLIDVLVYPRIRSRLLELVTALKPLEAMSMEKLVVGSDVGGNKELIEDGVNGLLFKAEDVTDLARVLDGIFKDPVRRDTLRMQGRVHVREKRSWHNLISAHADVYRHLGVRA
jgi:glycogen synthase